MTRCGGEGKNAEVFNSKLDSYETEAIFISGHRLPLRGRGGGGHEAQAQLIISVYPSQDNPTNQTLWIFSGSSTARGGNSIRSSTTSLSFNFRDLWEIGNLQNIYATNASSSGEILPLSPLLSSSNTKDIASVLARIPGGGRTNISFSSNSTNRPGITIRYSYREISSIYMRDYNQADNFADEMGIRVSGSNLSYSTNQPSRWYGSGLLNKPISDFVAGSFFNDADGPHFAVSSPSSVQITLNSGFIPEPEEYALVFGLFALGFVFFHRHFQRKKRQTTTS